MYPKTVCLVQGETEFPGRLLWRVGSASQMLISSLAGAGGQGRSSTLVSVGVWSSWPGLHCWSDRAGPLSFMSQFSGPSHLFNKYVPSAFCGLHTVLGSGLTEPPAPWS